MSQSRRNVSERADMRTEPNRSFSHETSIYMRVNILTGLGFLERADVRIEELVQDLFLESGRYMRDNILKDFPPEFRATTKQSNVSETYDMMTRPDMDKYVFMRVLEDRGAVELDADG